jgi:hypothetical protein
MEGLKLMQLNVSQEEAEKLLRDLNAASNDMKRGTGGKAGDGPEKRYGIAYQMCVKAGIKPPLKRKYRGGV